jgi:hypothetical protein
MRHALVYVLSITLALWLGGLIALFVSVSVLFGTARELGVQAAPVLFATFERYELGLFVVSIVLALAWRTPAKRYRQALLGCVLAAGGMVAVQVWVLSPKINLLRETGQSATPAFQQLHGQSTFVYVATAVLVLLAKIALITALLPKSRNDTVGFDVIDPPDPA